MPGQIQPYSFSRLTKSKKVSQKVATHRQTQFHDVQK
jgi:hypothetical protein